MKKLHKTYINIIIVGCVFALSMTGCRKEKNPGPVVTPWGEVQGAEIPDSASFSLQDILRSGEMIVLTLSGPESHYDYRGRVLGLHYLLCERFAKEIGVAVRVEVCQDTLEMFSKLKRGIADVIAYPLPDSLIVQQGLLPCGFEEALDETAAKMPPECTESGSGGASVPDKDKRESRARWAAPQSEGKEGSLACALDDWFEPTMIEEVKKEERQLLATPKVKRRVFSPFLNRSAGVISQYDALFQKYAPQARWDWRLMAAQCYQESCFDPNAQSWAGARGLMQIMPATATHLGLAESEICNPEANVRAASQLIIELTKAFSDIPNATERQWFVLAAYNGGSGHVRDAMALCQKMGGNPHSWCDVSRHLLLLREPEYYRDPVVKHGYIRSTETCDYVERIRERYAQYRGVPLGKGSSSPSSVPRRATKKHKYH